MPFLVVILSIALLVLLLSWLKFNPFLAFLVVSVVAGLLLGIPANKIPASLQHGIGDIFGGLLMILSLGAMLGKLVAESGAALQIANTLMDRFGAKYVQWALMIAAFIIGIPLFYGVGFVLMVPLIFSVVYQYKLPVIFIGLPALAALSVTHGFLPPHPSPSALVTQFKANIGLTLIYGLIVSIPVIILAGPVLVRFLRRIPNPSLQLFQSNLNDTAALPGKTTSFITALLPVILLIVSTILQFACRGCSESIKNWVSFWSDPSVVMLIALLIATFTLGIFQGKSFSQVMEIYTGGIKDIAMILLIVGGAGALKQVFADSGVNLKIAEVMNSLQLHPLVLGWMMAAIIRACIGSATIAGITAAGMLAPLAIQGQVNPNLLVLSVGAGSLMFSHVNDSGFWMFKEYFNLDIKNTLLSWSMMEMIIGIAGLICVLLLNLVV